MEDLQEQKETSKIVLNIQDTRRYFESQGGDMKSSKIPDGVVSRGCLCLLKRCLYHSISNAQLTIVVFGRFCSYVFRIRKTS